MQLSCTNNLYLFGLYTCHLLGSIKLMNYLNPTYIGKNETQPHFLFRFCQNTAIVHYGAYLVL